MRIICISLALIMLFFAGCGKSDNDNIQKEAAKVIKPLIKEGIDDKEVAKKVDELLKNKENLSEKEEKEMAENIVEEARDIVAKDIPELPEIVIDTKDVKIEWAGNDGAVMKAVAKKFSGEQKSNSMVLEDLTADLYEKGIKSATLTAHIAYLDGNSKEIRVDKGAKVVSHSHNGILTANKIVWKSKENKIFAQKGILESKAGKITGNSFVLDTKLEVFEVSDNDLHL